MRRLSWLRNWPRRRQSGVTSQTPRVPTQAESLEPKSLLSVSALFVSGSHLEINMTGDDDVRISSLGGNLLLEAAENGGVLKPYLNLGTIPASSVQSIQISGGDEDNTIDLSGLAAASFLSLTSIQANGYHGNDLLIGSDDFGELLQGDNGNDTIIGGAGNNTLDGGDGEDNIQALGGADSIRGGDGRDSIQSGAGNDTVDAGNGSDTVLAGSGDDSVIGANGEDSLSGEAGNDTLNGDGGADTIDGGDGDDSILGGELADSLLGGNGNDTINGQAGNDTIDGQAGDDNLHGAVGLDVVDGGDGNDTLNGGGGKDTLFGGLGDDSIIGGSGDDNIDGFDGNDTIVGQGGNDTILGGNGADLLRGGDGNDLISGGQPQLQIGDITVVEGNSGTTIAQFTVTLSAATTTTVTVDFNAVDGSALVNQDYLPAAGTVTFAPGTTTQTISVSIVTDTTLENDETFFVILSNAAGAELVGAVAQATIVNDDVAAPTVQVLYAVDGVTSTLYSINTSTGASTAIGPLGVGLAGLTAAPDGTLYGESIDQIYTVNTTTGAATPFLNLGAATIAEGDIAYNAATDEIFGIDFGQSRFVRIDTVAMTVNVVGTLNVGGVNATGGIDWDGLTYRGSTLYGYVGPRDGNTGLANQLFTVNETTAAVTAVAPLGTVAGFAGDIAYDSALDAFYLMSRASSNLYRIDPVTGAATLIGDTGIGDVFGLAMTGTAAPPPPVVVVPRPTVPGSISPDDTLMGDAGNDTLIGSGGNDLLSGGADNDLLDGASGNDSLLGGAGSDVLLGNLGDDTLTGQGGNDTVDGGDGSDLHVWDGAAGANDMIGDTVGDNTLLVRGTSISNVFDVSQSFEHLLTVSEAGRTVTVSPVFGRVIVDAGNGNDTINVLDLKSVQPILVEILGGNGNDVLSSVAHPGSAVRLSLDGGLGNDTLLGGAGDESMFGGDGIDSINGGAGNDTMDGGLGNDLMDGGDGNDLMLGGDGHDSMLGGNGNDLMSGNDGDDTLEGGFGNDTQSGNLGSDSLLGLNGNDSLLGNEGEDTLGGGADDDVLDGGRNNDLLLGGTGNDKIRGDHGNDTINGEDGDDTVNGGDGDDSILGGMGNDLLNGANGNDFLNGAAGNDIIAGGDGRDTLRGGGGSDVLLGEDGDDNIDGQSGTDTVAGNQGVDVIADPLAEINEAYKLSLDLVVKLQAMG